MENFGYVFLQTLKNLLIERMDKNETITARFLDAPEFQDAIGQAMFKDVYEQIRGEEAVA